MTKLAIARTAAVALTVGALAWPADVSAQRRNPDFLFKQPSMSVTVRGGLAMPTQQSEVFDFTSDMLTLGRSDFFSPAFALDVGIRTGERLDVVLGIGVAPSSSSSEFRDFVDLDDRPIEQETEFVRVPFTVSLKYYLQDRGRRISRFAWVPASFAPYVGIGGGGMWYRFEQRGDFVDFETLDIFTDILESEDTAAVGHAFAGFDYSLGPRWLLTTEARYSIGSATMGRDFVGFDDIDLGGFDVTVGFGIRF